MTWRVHMGFGHEVVKKHLFLYLPRDPSPSHSFIPSEILWTTQILVSGLCSMELSPDLTPSFQLYISLQIGSKDASFPVPVAFSSLHCDRCMCVWGRVRGRERGEGGERESVCVCMCVCRWIHRWVPPPPFFPPSVYLALRARQGIDAIKWGVL